MGKLILIFICLWTSTLGFAAPWPTPPDTISTPGQNASSPTAAIDENGNTVALWLENGVVQSNVATASGGWSSTITPISGSGASNPQVVIDSNGNATAVWLANGQLYTSSLPLQGSWSSATILSSSSSASSPQVAVDDNGNVIAVWVEAGWIKSATLLNGGSWPTTPDILSTQAGCSIPQVAIGTDSQTTCIVVWQGLANSIPTVFAISKPVTGTWGSLQTVSPPTLNSVYPQVAVDNMGKGTATWFSYNQTGTTFSDVIVQVSSQSSNLTWGSPVALTNPGLKDPAQCVLGIVAAPNQTTCVVWTTSYDGALFNCESSIYTNGAWQPIVIFSNSNVASYAIAIAMTARGNVFVVYMLQDPSSGD